MAICTASIYGYALRKIIEATACGCVVVTDLPSDEVLPLIDGNLVRVRPDIPPRGMARLLLELYDGYNAERQAEFSRLARVYYDWRTSGLRLAHDIEQMRFKHAPALAS